MNHTSLSYQHQHPEVLLRGSSRTSFGKAVRLDELGLMPRRASERPVNERSKYYESERDDSWYESTLEFFRAEHSNRLYPMTSRT